MEFEIINELTCGACKKKHDIATMRTDKYGEKMLCPKCYAKEFKREARQIRQKDGSVITVRAEKGSLAYSNPELVKRARTERMDHMVAYKCLHCNYEFKRRKAFPFEGDCPYCGRKKVAYDPIKTGQWVEQLW